MDQRAQDGTYEAHGSNAVWYFVGAVFLITLSFGVFDEPMSATSWAVRGVAALLTILGFVSMARRQ